MGKPRHWTATEWTAYCASISTDTLWDTQVHILDRAHRLVAVLPKSWTSGQVNIDVDQDVDRSCQVSILDSDGRLAALMADEVRLRYYVQVLHGTWVPSLGRWLWQPIFTGPATDAVHQGPVWDLTCAGKESLWTVTAPGDTIAKGMYVATAIKNVLTAAGEGPRLAIPSPAAGFNARVQKATPYGGEDSDRSRWKVCKKLAAGAGYHLFVDGEGWYVLRKLPSAAAPAFEFTPGLFLSEPKFSSSLAISNRWYGRGAGSLSDDVFAEGPFSANNLAVGEKKVPWYSVTYAGQNTSWTTKTKLLAAGKAALLKLLTFSRTVEGDFVPFHAAEPLDVNRYTTPSQTVTLPLRQASIPFAAELDDTGTGEGWPMSIGLLKKARIGALGRSRVRGKPPRPHKRHHKKKRR